MEEHHLNINILSVFMEKIFEEMWDWLVSDVSAHHDMPEIFYFKKRNELYGVLLNSGMVGKKYLVFQIFFFHRPCVINLLK